MPAHPLARNFTITPDDIEYLTGVLLEQETPMLTEELALLLLDKRLTDEKEALEARYRGTRVYHPVAHYETGERLIFTEMDDATATVRAVRPGDNADYGTYRVIAVDFDDKTLNLAGGLREFASDFVPEHPLNQARIGHALTADGSSATSRDILHSDYKTLMITMHEALQKSGVLMRVAGYWFPRDLVMDIDVGTLHLAEAVLDMASGGPLPTRDIIEQVGGVGSAPMTLQVFSLNLAMSRDNRFDEVGPAGEVLWYLNRMEPDPVRRIPDLLQYRAITYNEDLLSDEMDDLETELDDELTDIDFEGTLKKATSTLLYPHRRAGTLPLNAKTRTIFPTGRTPRIHVALVDATDGEHFPGWVVHEHKYVYGLEPYYAKHRLPVGARLSVEKGERPGQIILSYEGYKPRTEYIKIFIPGDQIQFENRRRAIGAAYDELLIFGVDDLAALDTMVKAHQKQSMVALLRLLLAELGRLSPQGTVHVVTLYSVMNVFRRCPPGPVFALLRANPEFEDVGDHYWKLSQ
ncbi:MAG: hypothetical protein MUE40_01110 [Anaerolineae bacterium]|jgi:hypothetical protein|nr:hypothetical protein [Anaerolineae bacterium]